MKVNVLMAMTADGRIAKNSHEVINWTSKADKQLFKKLTCESGCIVMGNNTYQSIGKPLPNRFNVVLTKQPEKFTSISNQLLFTSDPPEKLLASLKNQFDCVFICGGAQINSLFFEKNLVDELYVTIEPQLFGPGLCLVEQLKTSISLELLNCEKLGDNSVLIHYKVLKP